jgi:tetratricopeptide (TPR) repeat protein
VIIMRFAAICVLLASVVTCGRFEASRDFNFGVRYFNEEKFDAAIRSFEKAATARVDPVIAYNLALSHLAALRELSSQSEETNLSPEQIAPALASVASAQELPDPEEEMLAKMGYIEGEIYSLAGNSEAAHSAFARSLSADPDFPPTLKAQLKLDSESDTALAKLVLATADVEELEPEEKLSP